MAKYLRVTFSDNTVWDVPIEVIARSRAEHYADEFGNDVERSYREDSLPLLEASDSEVYEWASNNMNWSDMKAAAIQQPSLPVAVDYEEEWANCDTEVVER
ncbi:hypothetical protein [Singulisphaera sp. PoT]|uniref:hypothetical protein n=1 Tax=Singulisphaera sp. PoT TaxID=3411797 RepID=UPI003BF619E4